MKESYPAWLRSHGLMNKNPGARCEIPPYEELAVEAPEATKQYRPLPFLLVTHQNLM